MNLVQEFFNKNIIKNILIIILIIFEIAIFSVFYNKYNKLNITNNELNLTIQNQTKTIEDLKKHKDDLNNKVSNLEKENHQLKKEKEELENKINTENHNVVKDKTNANNKAETEKKKPSTTKPHETSKRDFKSYMSYTAITNKSSKQWALQQQATTDKNGFRCIDGKPMVAVGTGWGLSVGDHAVVTCSNGNSFAVVIGDIKSNRHTLSDNKTTASNGCRCEFIVDVESLNKTIKKMGNVSALSAYSGYVTNIK